MLAWSITARFLGNNGDRAAVNHGQHQKLLAVKRDTELAACLSLDKAVDGIGTEYRRSPRLKLAGLKTGKEDDSPRAFRISLKHGSINLPSFYPILQFIDEAPRHGQGRSARAFGSQSRGSLSAVGKMGDRELSLFFHSGPITINRDSEALDAKSGHNLIFSAF
jgi:hypothetical protein